MTDSKKPANKTETPAQEEHVSATEMEELKRDMRSAQFIDWAQKNSQQLIAAAVVFVVLLLGATYWVEHQKSEKNAAAVIYQKAMTVNDTEAQKALFQQVVKEHAGSGYAHLAELQLGRFDDGEAYLQQLADDSSASDALRWQARLDLAERKINAGNNDAAMALLNKAVGVEYEQLRHYLMARATSGATRIEHLKQAQAEISHDEDLRQKIDMMLAETNAAQ